MYDVTDPDYAWLNLEKADIKHMRKPLTPVTKEEKDNFHLKVLSVMRNPEYFHWTCKHLFNIDLLPSQVVILQELWGHSFPIFIGSRGLGKAQPVEEPILTKNGWIKMGNIKIGDMIYSRDGNLHNVTHIHPQGKKQICRLTLADGRVLDSCEDHLWVVTKENIEVIISTKDIILSGLISDEKNYKYKIPNCQPIEFEQQILPINPYAFGLLLSNNKEKFIPEIYKHSSVKDRTGLICGLLDGCGSVSKDIIELNSKNKRLLDDLTYVLRSLGVSCSQNIGKLYINIVELDCPIIKAEYTNEYTDMQCITVDSPDQTYITKDFTVTHNSFLLGIYCLLKNILIPDSKIVIVGAAFRQSKIIFDYMDKIWKTSPMLHTICSDSSGPYRGVDRCDFRVNSSITVALPLGNGDKIRGLRAHTIICDEFNSIPIEIYETVVLGFAAVSKDPADNVKLSAKRRKLKMSGNWSEEQEIIFDKTIVKNQSILSGTCGYDFEPFAKYWKKYHAIIKHKGDKKSIANEVGEEEEEEALHGKLNHKEFSIIRIPYELIPEGFMDDQTVSRAKSTMHTSTYNREYAAVFPKDSYGFFKRSLIESCTASDKNCDLPNWPYWCPQSFNMITRGSHNKQYVYGVDPASEEDNFAISVLELHQEHQRVVYGWTTNKKDFQQRKTLGLTDANDYYSFCCRKIRELMRVFPCVKIALDTQGGGYAVAEALSDPSKLMPGELPIFPSIVEGKEELTDNFAGLHIIDYISFSDASWTSQSNHGMRKDMEDKVLLFPQLDVVALAVVSENDRIEFENLKKVYGTDQATRLFDTLEDAYLELQELKEELSLIVMTKTEHGRERWSTPEVKLGTGKKGRMRKDRYSALLMANSVARHTYREPQSPSYVNVGRVVHGETNDVGGRIYASAPEWLQNIETNVFQVVRRS